MTERTPVWYGRCCRIWPLALGIKPGSCGLCGSDEFEPCTEEEFLEQQADKEK
jgi:hypothetical protein